MADLTTNINQAISDFSTIKQAIIDKGVEVPIGTPTSEYGKLIGNIQSGGSVSDLLPNPMGLTIFFDYKNGVDTTSNTWTDMVSGTTYTATGAFTLTEDCIEMNGKTFSMNYGEGISAFTIYAIVCNAKYISGWSGFIGEYGNTPQFNLANNNGRLAIGSGTGSGQYTSNVKSYEEWHVCCITLNETFGAFYIDGTKVYSYNGYAIPRFTTSYPLIFGYGNIKMMAICPNVAHGLDIVSQNSEYLNSKYIT